MHLPGQLLQLRAEWHSLRARAFKVGMAPSGPVSSAMLSGPPAARSTLQRKNLTSQAVRLLCITSIRGLGHGVNSINDSARVEEEDINAAVDRHPHVHSAIAGSNPAGKTSRSCLDVESRLHSITTDGTRGMTGPLILHFIGHGLERGLLFEDVLKQVIAPDPRHFADWVHSSSPSCVLINSCHSESLARAVRKKCGNDTAVLCWKGRAASDACMALTKVFYSAETFGMFGAADSADAELFRHVLDHVSQRMCAERWLGKEYWHRDPELASRSHEWVDNARRDDDNVLVMFPIGGPEFTVGSVLPESTTDAAPNEDWPGPRVDCSLFLEADGRLVASPEFGRYLSEPTGQVGSGSETVFRGKKRLFGVEGTLYPKSQTLSYLPPYNRTNEQEFTFTAADWDQCVVNYNNGHVKLVFSQYFPFEVPSRELWYEIDRSGRFDRRRSPGNKDRFLILHVHFARPVGVDGQRQPPDPTGNFGAVNGVNARWSAERPSTPACLTKAQVAALPKADSDARKQALKQIGNYNAIIGRTVQDSMHSRSLTGKLTKVTGTKSGSHMAIGRDWQRFTVVKFKTPFYADDKVLGPRWADCTQPMSPSDADLDGLVRRFCECVVAHQEWLQQEGADAEHIGPVRSVEDWHRLCLPIERADQRDADKRPAPEQGFGAELPVWEIKLWVRGGFPRRLASAKSPLHGNHRHAIYAVDNPDCYWKGDNSGWDYLTEPTPPPFPVNLAVQQPAVPHPVFKTPPVNDAGMAVLRDMLIKAEQTRRTKHKAPAQYALLDLEKQRVYARTGSSDAVSKRLNLTSNQNWAWRSSDSGAGCAGADGNELAMARIGETGMPVQLAFK